MLLLMNLELSDMINCHFKHFGIKSYQNFGNLFEKAEYHSLAKMFSTTDQ